MHKEGFVDLPFIGQSDAVRQVIGELALLPTMRYPACNRLPARRVSLHRQRFFEHIQPAPALRVLSGPTCGPRPSASDIDSVSGSALPNESDLDLDDLASRVAERFMSSRRQIPDVAAIGG